MILLVTSKDDLTTDYLIRRLVERGLQFFRFNAEDLLSNYQVLLSVGDEVSDFIITDTTRGVSLRREEITGAYFRKPRAPEYTHERNSAEVLFNQGELREVLRSIWRLISNEKWLNSPDALWFAGNKIRQLTYAKDVGFKIPETLISSSPKALLGFIDKHKNKVIAKAVKNGFFVNKGSATLIFTRELNDLDFDGIRRADTIVPAIIQPKLEKKYDLRITVVGDKVFPVALLSQQYPETSIDWRAWDTIDNLNLKHQVFDAPKDVVDKCLELNRKFNLKFSCIDMVLTTEDEFYFLEVNPNGQWAWIEDLLAIPIRDSIIDQLSNI